MTTINSARIHVGDFEIAIQCFESSDERDPLTPDIATQPQPLPVSDWPLTPVEVELLAREKLHGSGAKTDRRDDCTWAATFFDHPAGEHYWREAKTDGQLDLAHAAASRAVLRGDLT